jgi:hypothetical protein
VNNERFTAYVMGANSSLKVTRQSIGGFLAKTGGTVTVTNDNGVVIVDAHPVTAGLYYPMPFLLQTTTGGTVSLAGGASGVLAV